MQRKIQPQTIENTSIQAAIFDRDGVLLDFRVDDFPNLARACQAIRRDARLTPPSRR